MKRPCLIVCLSLMLMTSCGTARYAPRTETAAIALQWPFQPAPAKVTFARSLTGMDRRKSLGRSIGSVLSGQARSDRDGFVLPVAVASGIDGRLAVADMGQRCVHLYIPAEQRYVRIPREGEEPIASPVGVAFDEELRLYVADSAGRVMAFGTDGSAAFSVSSAGSEPLQRPTGLAWSPGRRLLYVVDTLAHRVHAFDSGLRSVFSFGRRGSEPGEFNFPTHIFRASSGELYVTDALNFRVQIFDEDGTPRGVFGHHGDGSGDFAMPKGIAVDRDGVVYVVDGMFDIVQMFNRSGELLLTLGRRGTDFGEFWLPSGAFLSDEGELYVCDTYNHRVQIYRITEGYDGAL